MKHTATRFASAAAMLSPALAFAAPDVTSLVSEIGDTAAPIAAIGGAVLLVIVGIKVFKWLRGTL